MATRRQLIQQKKKAKATAAAAVVADSKPLPNFNPRFPMLPVYIYASLAPALVALFYFAWQLSGSLTMMAGTGDWPEVTGKITEARVVGKKGDAMGKARFYPIVSYTYEVNGSRFRGTRIMLGFFENSPFLKKMLPGIQRDFVSNKKDARKIIKKYKKGSEVAVHYWIQNPTFAVLEPVPRDKIRNIAMLVYPFIGVLLFGMAAYAYRFRHVLKFSRSRQADISMDADDIRATAEHQKPRPSI